MVFSAAQFRLSVVSYGLPHETTRQARDCDDGAIAFSDSPCRRGSTQLPRAIQMLRALPGALRGPILVRESKRYPKLLHQFQ